MAKRCKHHIENMLVCKINYGLDTYRGRCRGADICDKFVAAAPTVRQIALKYQGSDRIFVVDLPAYIKDEDKEALQKRLNEILTSVAFHSSKDTRASVRHQIKMALGI